MARVLSVAHQQRAFRRHDASVRYRCLVRHQNMGFVMTVIHSFVITGVPCCGQPFIMQIVEPTCIVADVAMESYILGGFLQTPHSRKTCYTVHVLQDRRGRKTCAWKMAHLLKRQSAQKKEMKYTNVLPLYPDGGGSSPIGYIPLDLYENSTTLQANANFNGGQIILSGGELVKVKCVYKYIDDFSDRVEMKAIESRKLHKLTQLRELISFWSVSVPPHKWDVIPRYDPVWREMAQRALIVLLTLLQSHMQALFRVDVDSCRRFLDVHAPCSLSHFRIVGEDVFRKRRGSTLVPDSMKNVIQSYNTVAEVGHPQFAIYYNHGAMTEPEKMRQLICGAIDRTKREPQLEWPEFCLLHIKDHHFDAMTRQYVTTAWFGIKIPDEHSKSNTSLP